MPTRDHHVDDTSQARPMSRGPSQPPINLFGSDVAFAVPVGLEDRVP